MQWVKIVTLGAWGVRGKFHTSACRAVTYISANLLYWQQKPFCFCLKTLCEDENHQWAGRTHLAFSTCTARLSWGPFRGKSCFVNKVDHFLYHPTYYCSFFDSQNRNVSSSVFQLVIINMYLLEYNSKFLTPFLYYVLGFFIPVKRPNNIVAPLYPIYTPLLPSHSIKEKYEEKHIWHESLW